MRDEGESREISIGGVVCHFHWCRRGEPLMIEGFWIQKFPITHGIWKFVMREQPQREDILQARQPVRNVSWNECRQFIAELNRTAILADVGLAEYHFVLPTEAQWEYAHDNGFLDIGDALEWCFDIDEETGYPVVRGDGIRNVRTPIGYDNVGFRLVIVPRR